MGGSFGQGVIGGGAGLGLGTLSTLRQPKRRRAPGRRMLGGVLAGLLAGGGGYWAAKNLGGMGANSDISKKLNASRQETPFAPSASRWGSMV